MGQHKYDKKELRDLIDKFFKDKKVQKDLREAGWQNRKFFTLAAGYSMGKERLEKMVEDNFKKIRKLDLASIQYEGSYKSQNSGHQLSFFKVEFQHKGRYNSQNSEHRDSINISGTETGRFPCKMVEEPSVTREMFESEINFEFKGVEDGRTDEKASAGTNGCNNGYDRAKYPHNCPSCGAPSYNDPIFDKVDCSAKCGGCKEFV